MRQRSQIRLMRGQWALDGCHLLKRADQVDLVRHDLPHVPWRRPDLPKVVRYTGTFLYADQHEHSL
jgi:hypothetical protein